MFTLSKTRIPRLGFLVLLVFVTIIAAACGPDDTGGGDDGGDDTGDTSSTVAHTITTDNGDSLTVNLPEGWEPGGDIPGGFVNGDDTVAFNTIPNQGGFDVLLTALSAGSEDLETIDHNGKQVGLWSVIESEDQGLFSLMELNDDLLVMGVALGEGAQNQRDLLLDTLTGSALSE